MLQALKPTGNSKKRQLKMGYYIRVLGTADPNIHIDELLSGLTTEGLTANFCFDQNEGPDNWPVLGVANSSGDELIQIDRNPVLIGELGHEELEEFRAIIQDYKPASAVEWLCKYFDTVKVIYAFQLLNASFDDSNFPIVSSIKNTIWNRTNGILQADNEGFSNTDGYHILWQFSDDVKGDWNMAIINQFGHWSNFTMDLGDQKQREEFCEGKIPEKSTKL